MNPQTPSYLDPWSIFLLLSQEQWARQSGKLNQNMWQIWVYAAVHSQMQKSTATTERLNLRTFFSWLLSSQILVGSLKSTPGGWNRPFQAAKSDGPGRANFTKQPGHWTWNLCVVKTLPLQCHPQQIWKTLWPVSGGNLKSFMFWVLTMDVVRSAFDHHRFSEPTPAALGIAMGRCPWNLEAFQYRRTAHMLCQITWPRNIAINCQVAKFARDWPLLCNSFFTSGFKSHSLMCPKLR